MISVTFPDGNSRQFEPGLSGADIAKSISPSLLKRTVAMMRDGVLSDLSDPLDGDAKLEFLTRDDPRALELIRHDAAHVLAEAVQSLWPGTQVTIGPVIENGFYYDFARAEPFTPEDFAAIEKRMREIIAKRQALHQGALGARPGQGLVQGARRRLQDRARRHDPGGRGPEESTSQGDWLDLCRGPHMTSTGKVGAAFKLMKVAGAYWRGDSEPADAAAHLRDRVRQAGRPRRLPQAARRGRAPRPPAARARDGPVPFPGGGARHRLLASEGLDAVPDAHLLHAPAAGGGRLHGGEHAAGARQGALWEMSGHWGTRIARTCSSRRRPRTTASSRSSR